jgi:hypothetical protein
MSTTRVLAGSVAVLLGVSFIPNGVSAHHRWGKYHWERSSSALTLAVGDNVDSTWQTALNAAISDWNVSPILDLNTANGGTNPVTCAPTLGRIEVCNASYGNTGWLGIAQIWIGSGQHIVQAITKVNDTYFDTAEYNTSAWRRLVMCQEIAHDFGLDHQDENFTNQNLGTCMDYTDDPDGTLKNQLSNVSPNAHDYEQIASIYSHLDGSGTGGGGGGGGRGRPGGAGARGTLPGQAFSHLPDNSQASWGLLIASNGRIARYVLDLGNGNLIFTFVIWA